MVEVTKQNYCHILPEVMLHIEKADFIAIDCEFTGLSIGPEYERSLFDTPEVRYLKDKENIKQMTVTQVGLTAFSKLEEENRFVASTYNFYVFPSSLHCLDTTFLCQSSCLKWLSVQKFDFNKFIYQGIPYLNRAQQAEINEIFATDGVTSVLSYFDSCDLFQKISTKISQWLVSAKYGDELHFHEEEDFSTLCFLQELMSNIWATWQDGHLVVKKIKEDEKKEFLRDKKDDLSSIKKELIGFSLIIEKIISSKKILVGHNMMLDLMMLYQKFVDELPKTYHQFKMQILKTFAHTYDTKHMVQVLNQTKKCRTLRKTALDHLYQSLSRASDWTLGLHSAKVSLRKGFQFDVDQTPHQAGFDSYMCGFVFLKLLYLDFSLYHKLEGNRVLEVHELIQDLKSKFEGRINLIRSTVDYINLYDVDHYSHKTTYVVVESCDKLPVDLRLKRQLAKFGDIDMRRLCSRGLCVQLAANSFKVMEDVTDSLIPDRRFRIMSLEMWKRKKRRKVIKISLFSISVATLALLFFKKIFLTN